MGWSNPDSVSDKFVKRGTCSGLPLLPVALASPASEHVN